MTAEGSKQDQGQSGQGSRRDGAVDRRLPDPSAGRRGGAGSVVWAARRRAGSCCGWEELRRWEEVRCGEERSQRPCGGGRKEPRGHSGAEKKARQRRGTAMEGRGRCGRREVKKDSAGSGWRNRWCSTDRGGKEPGKFSRPARRCGWVAVPGGPRTDLVMRVDTGCRGEGGEWARGVGGGACSRAGKKVGGGRSCHGMRRRVGVRRRR